MCSVQPQPFSFFPASQDGLQPACTNLAETSWSVAPSQSTHTAPTYVSNNAEGSTQLMWTPRSHPFPNFRQPFNNNIPYGQHTSRTSRTSRYAPPLAASQFQHFSFPSLNNIYGTDSSHVQMHSTSIGISPLIGSFTDTGPDLGMVRLGVNKTMATRDTLISIPKRGRPKLLNAFCSVCGTTESRHWRRLSSAERFCNACGLKLLAKRRREHLNMALKNDRAFSQGHENLSIHNLLNDSSSNSSS
eukprot:GILJ01013418.1.p1 GENE.GILJ01013418.1~~GILJ01013418.1.p1  ORF type:complete len:245 (+),score=14.11 GILJ01013418.1:158-892(+)